MPSLYSYTIPIDDGAAPNPFHGMCTLAICKPGIRRTAVPGDWVAGLGSRKAPSGDLSGRLVYAMKVEEVLTLSEYDRQAKSRWPHRIPNVKSAALQDRLGDCIYDFSSHRVEQRLGVHGPENMATDLGGMNVLISRDFYYFGSRAMQLPNALQGICHQGVGHRKGANDQYFDRFVRWIRSFPMGQGQLYGWPDYILDWGPAPACGGCKERVEDDVEY